MWKYISQRLHLWNFDQVLLKAECALPKLTKCITLPYCNPKQMTANLRTKFGRFCTLKKHLMHLSLFLLCLNLD